MRLSQIKFIFFEGRRTILLLAVVGGLLGMVAFYLYPFGYVAQGSLFVTRKTDTNLRQDFTYEGYYARSSAGEYTETVIGILESVDIRKNVLEDTGLVINRKSLSSLSKNLTVRKKAPQVIWVGFKGHSSDYTKSIWNSFVDNTIKTSNRLNEEKGDPNFSVTRVGDPVVIEQYNNLIVFTLVGLLLGVFVSTGIIFGKSKFL